MEKYTLFAREMLNYYVNAQKYIMYICLISSVFLFLTTFWVYEMIYFLFIALFLTILFVGRYILGRKSYGNKILITSEGLEVYSINDKFLYFLKFSKWEISEKWILFDGPRASFEKKCLLFYRDIVIYEEMEYKSYWRNKNILFIQNPKAIEMLKRSYNVEVPDEEKN